MIMPPGSRGYYEGTDSSGMAWQIPREVDPDLDGTKFAGHHPRLFDTNHANDSIEVASFDRLVEAQVPPQILRRIDQTIEAGKFLAGKGLADVPPIDLSEWRRGIILSWSHARDLVVVHDALRQPRNVAGHDVDELVLAVHLKNKLATTSNADQWYNDYVSSLDEGAWVNVGFFNPNLSASMYKWGDAKGGTQNAMDAHRFAAHHQGSDEHPLDWVERAVNFVVHHIPREHRGIRHEPRGNWSDLEARMVEDPAIKDAPIGKGIARDAARIFQMLESEGKIIPWQLLKVPADEVTPSMIEHAHLVVQAARSRSLLGLDLASPTGDEEDEAANPERVARAEALLQKLPVHIEAAHVAGRHDLAARYQEWLADHG